MTSYIDHTNGRILELDGEIYYSPNSSRQVRPSPPKDTYELRNVFRTKLTHDRPMWWTPEFGWMAFVPLKPSYVGFPFSKLARIPIPQLYEGEGYSLPRDFSNRWAIIEDALIKATSLLAQRYQLPAVRPYAPWAVGYGHVYKTSLVAARQAKRSRDWFSIWMGLLSFLIASGETKTEHTKHLERTAALPWREVLAKEDFDEIWLSGIAASSVCSFKPEEPRVGLFVDLLSDDDRQPPVAWYCHFNIPVWYKWSEREEHIAAVNHSFAQLAPPPDRRPIPIPPTYVPPAHSSTRSNDTGQRAWAEENIANWEEFFSMRKRRYAERVERESAVGRQRRLKLERNPPTKSVKVFEWLPGIRNPEILVRMTITAANASAVLSSYPSAQKHYDPFEHEWDCCAELSPADRVEDDMHDGDAYTVGGLLIDPYSNPLAPPPLQSSFWETAGSRSSSISYSTTDPSAEDIGPLSFDLERVHSYEPLDILAEHYGFNPSRASLTMDATEILEPKEKTKFLRMLGLTHTEDKFFETASSQIARQFFSKLIKGDLPNAQDWDLADGRFAPLRQAERLKFCQKLQDNFFIFDFQKYSTVRWMLAVTTAPDALFVCRLSEQLDEYEVCRCLLQQGIPFLTLVPVTCVPRPLDSPGLMLPTRYKGYVFSKKDYDAYREQCEIIFNIPRARAALLMGGILWRLVVETLSFDDALRGPSIAATVDGTGFRIAGRGAVEVFGDDDLTEIEIQLLCGTYNCYTGSGLMMSLKSWFPLPNFNWKPSGENYGRWTMYNEMWYQKRLTAIEGGAQPLGIHDWRSHLRGDPQFRKLKTVASKLATEFLSSNAMF